ncbi:unnamed protein product [Lampetra planeri]
MDDSLHKNLQGNERRFRRRLELIFEKVTTTTGQRNVKQYQHAKEEEETLCHSENLGALDESDNSFDEKQYLTENGMLEGSLQEQDTSAMSVEMVNLPSTPSMQHTATNHHGGQLLKCVIMEISPEGSHAPINRTATETSPASSDEAVPADVSNSTIGEVYPYMLAKLSKLIAKDSSRHTKHRASHHIWRKNGHFQLAAGRARVVRERKRLDAAARSYGKSLARDHRRSASPSLLRHRSVPLSFPSPRSEHRHSDWAHSLRAEALAHSMSYVQTNAGLRSPASIKHRENIHRNLMPRKLSYSNQSDSGKDSRSHHLFKSHSKLL